MKIRLINSSGKSSGAPRGDRSTCSLHQQRKQRCFINVGDFITVEIESSCPSVKLIQRHLDAGSRNSPWMALIYGLDLRQLHSTYENIIIPRARRREHNERFEFSDLSAGCCPLVVLFSFSIVCGCSGRVSVLWPASASIWSFFPPAWICICPCTRRSTGRVQLTTRSASVFMQTTKDTVRAHPA